MAQTSKERGERVKCLKNVVKGFSKPLPQAMDDALDSLGRLKTMGARLGLNLKQYGGV